MDAESKFDEKDILNQLDEIKTYYFRRDKEVRTDVELYNHEFILDVPEGFHQIKSPTTRSMCDRAADRIGSGRFQAHMEPRNDSTLEAKRVEKKEKAGSVLPYLMRRRQKYNPIRGLALHAFNRGAMVAKIQVDQGMTQPAPDRKDYNSDVEHRSATKLWAYKSVSQFPVSLDARPIEHIYPDPETDGDNWVIEHYERRVGDIKKNFPNWEGWASYIARDSKGKFAKRTPYDDNSRVRYTEVWSKKWRAVMVEGEFLPIGNAEPGVVPNLFGRPPYFIRYSGFGDPAGVPHQRCVSILRGIRDTSRSMSRLFSIIDTVAENEAYGATLLKSGDTGNENFEIGPGAKNIMDFPEAVRPYSSGGVNQTLLAALAAVQAANEYGSVNSEAIGQPPPGGRGPFPQSGVAAAISTGQASMVIDPVNSALEDLFSDIVPFLFYLFDDVLEIELPVFGQVGEGSYVQFTLTTKDIDNHYGPVFMKNQLRSPEDDYAKYQLGMQGLSTGLPPEFVMEKFFGQENAHAMVKDMMAKQIAYSPKVRDEYLIPRLLERLQAKNENRAEALPGSKVPVPAGAPPQQIPVDPMTGQPVAPMGAPPNGQPTPDMGTAPTPGPPSDMLTRATMGLPSNGPMLPNGPAVPTRSM